MTEVERPNPDALLSSIQREEAANNRGQLKVFLGMCPGVGKTYAMLEAAHRELKTGRDVVIAYVETHGRKETDVLAEGIPYIARKALEYRGITLGELDLDAVLARRPDLAVVDELAHTNVPGSRHPKRWQDVQELLDAGINVLTTVNVQHIESRSDTVRQITGSEIHETVPDSILDKAVLELVDLPPSELVQRLHEGKVYVPDRAAAALKNFFREGNLTALRELALRLVADHVGEDTAEFRRTEPSAGPWKTGNRLLVAVGPSPLSEPLIRWTRRMADELRCPWLGVHVESSRPLAESAQTQLAKNLETARELGAEVVTTTDDDVARGLLRVAQERNVTQIIFGKPTETGLFHWFQSGRLLRRLMQESGDIDLHVIKSEKALIGSGKWHWRPLTAPSFKQYGLALGVIFGTGLLNLGLTAFAGPRVPGLIFLLAVVLLALFVGRGPVFLAGTLSALAWNFFFLPPRGTLVIEHAEDAILFVTYFVVALVLGQLVARIRAQGEAERRREERSTALYELTREFSEAASRDEVVWQLINQVNRLFRAPAAVSLPVGERFVPYPDSTLTLTEKELSVSDWAFRQGKAAGRFTDNLPGADALHLPMATNRKTLGVLAVALPVQNLPLAQRDLLETFARQAALVLDRIELRTAAEQTRLFSESERLSRVLLNSISHELRTPLAASTSAASALAEAEDAPQEHRRALLREIQEANTRLNRIIGNLLDVARLESGKVVPRLDWNDARDLVQTTIRELQRELSEHPVKMEIPAEPMLVRLDFTLLQHALANLLVNAATHTPRGTPIDVQARFAENALLVIVADRGPGIPPEILPRIFDKFFRAPNAPTGGSGLGLTIAKGFVEAQGGTITAANRPGGGAIFTLNLPQTEK
ncbi:MAG: two-component system sensor histidine kinase KdpD [Verrucomicrobiales bacterium]|nr:two-component system sensor histidine kinase KdpD [Verrucomicrobiales bacterium]